MLDKQTTAEFDAIEFDTTITPLDAPAKRTRNYRHPGPMPETAKTRLGTLDGSPVVYVALGGRGFGLDMLLDPSDLDAVLALSPVWVLGGCRRGSSPGYVMSGVRAAGALANQKSAGVPVAYLSRVLTGAGRQESVRYKNKDTLDLRRGNLIVMGRRQALAETGHGKA